MPEDLSRHHRSVSNLFTMPDTPEGWSRYLLKDRQVEFYREHGYLSGIRMLQDEHVDALRDELREILSETHRGRHLFYEYHSNESADPGKILFHALGPWRVKPGFHEQLGNPALRMACLQSRKEGTTMGQGRA